MNAFSVDFRLSGSFLSLVSGSIWPSRLAWRLSSLSLCERLPDSFPGSCGSCLLHLLVPHDTCCELGLGLGKTGTGAAVHAVDLERNRKNLLVQNL